MEMPEPDLTKCPRCGGENDNGHDRCIPPNPYYCTKCENCLEDEIEYPSVIHACPYSDHQIYFLSENDGVEWMANPYHHDRIVQALKRENEELQAKLDKAKDALRFYADKSGYVYGEFNNDAWEIKEGNISMKDKGQLARKTISEIGE